MSRLRRSELVQVVAQLGHLHLDVLALADAQDQILHFALNQAVALQVLPVVVWFQARVGKEMYMFSGFASLQTSRKPENRSFAGFAG